VNLPDLTGRVVIDNSPAKSALAEMKQQAAQFATAASTSFQAFAKAAVKDFATVGDSFKDIGKEFTAGFTVPISAGFSAVALASTGFDREMTKSMSIMGRVSDETRKKLEDGARSVARTMGVSHEEAAKSYYYLASAGLSVEQSMQALLPVAQFAKAGFMDMNTATELLMDSQSALGLRFQDSARNAAEMTRVADVLTQASILSNASVQQLAESLGTKSAASMRTFNVSVEQGVAVLAAYADQGVKGQIAGERFDILLRELTTQALDNSEAFKAAGISVFDHSGQLRNVADILVDVERRFSGMSTATKIAQLETLGFRAEANSAVLALVGMSDKISDTESKLKSAGGTMKEVSEKNLKSFSEQLNLLKTEASDIAIELGQSLLPTLRDLVDMAKSRVVPAFASASQAFGSFSTETKNTMFAVAGLTAVAGPALWATGSLMAGVVNLATAMKALAATSVVTGVLSALRWEMDLARLAAVGYAGASTALASSLGVLAAGAIGLGVAFKSWSLAQDIDDAYESLRKTEGQISRNIELKKRLDQLRPFDQAMKSGLSGALEGVNSILARLNAEENAAKAQAIAAAKAAEANEKRRAADQKFAEENYALWKKFYDDLDELRMDANKDFLAGPGKSTKASMPGLEAASQRWLKDAADMIGEQDSALGLFPTDAAAEKAKFAAAEQAKAAETAARWAGALQGVALMAGAIGGKIGDAANVMGNIAESFKGWNTLDAQGNHVMSKNAKIAAVALAAGQIGGLIGGKAGSFLQGAGGGAAAGAAFGPWGAAVGGVIGGIGGLFGASKAQKADLLDAKKQLEGLSETAQKFGIDLTRAFSSKSIHEVKGAIDSVNQAVKDQEKRLAGLATFSQGFNARVVSERDKDGKLLRDKDGNIVHQGSITDQASSDRAGRFAMFAFGNQVKETGDIFGALDAIGPALDEMAAAAKEFGYEMPKGVSELLKLNGMDEGLKSQVSGLNMMTKGIADSGLVTKAMFNDLGAEAVATRARLEEAGIGGAQALGIMQPSLQQLYEMQKLHGYAVDDTTKALLDEAKAQGVVGDQFMSTGGQMVELMKVLILAVGGELPEAFRAAGDGVDTFGSKISNLPRDVDLNVRTHYTSHGGGPPLNNDGTPDLDGDPSNSFANGTGFRNFGSGTRVTLHGEEAVLTRPQTDRLVSMAVSGVAGSSVPQRGGDEPIMVQVMVDGDVLLTAAAKRIKRNTIGGTEIKAALGGR
jgi:TP901 family phage tail tape measure protein